MYDTIIIGAGMSGLAAGIRLAYYDQRVCILERHYTIGGLNSFYRLARARLRRRPARAHQRHAEGHEDGPARPAAAATADAAGTTSRSRRRSARRSRFPACGCRFDNNSRTLRDEVACGVSATRPTISIASRRNRRLRRSERDARRHLGPRSRELDHPRAAARRNVVLPADVLRLGPRARHGLGPVLDHVPQHFSGRARPARRRACG